MLFEQSLIEEAGMSDFFDLVRERYSCRKFAHKPVEPHLIDEMIRACMCAPTARNSQPFRIWFVRSDEGLNLARSCTPYHFDAPLLAVLGADPREVWRRDASDIHNGAIDASIVGTHLIFAAHELGLGSTWVGNFDAKQLKSTFPIMSDYDLYAMFALGYPAHDSRPSPMHSRSRPRTDVISYL